MRRTLLRRLLHVDELGLFVRRDPDLLAEVGPATLRDRIDRHRAPEPRRALDRLDDPDVGEAFPAARFGIDAIADALREVRDLGGDLIALGERARLRAVRTLDPQ